MFVPIGAEDDGGRKYAWVISMLILVWNISYTALRSVTISLRSLVLHINVAVFLAICQGILWVL
jgi:hypothetical protein